MVSGIVINGKTHERVYDVAVSDDRKIDADGRCKALVGNTVNVEEATYTNAIGAPLLGGFWKDPDFDPDEKAFYYVRVIEIPTPRWTTIDAKVFGVELPDDVAPSIQEGPTPRRYGTTRKVSPDYLYQQAMKGSLCDADYPSR